MLVFTVCSVQVMEAVDVVEAAGSLDDPPSGEDETTDEEGPLPPLDDSSPEQSEDEPEEDEPSSQTAKDGTLWQSVPKPKVGKTPAKNVFRKPPTQLQGCQNVTTSSHAFNLFVSDKIISDVVKCTNIEGRRVKKDAWVPTNDEEIEAVIGMLLFLGTKKHNMLSTEEIWDSSYGHPIIRACMGRRRFQTLMTHMRFDDKSTRNARRERDVFAPFRDVWDKFQKSLKSHYIPGPLLTVDEQLVPFRGRCSFLQYLPSKPDRYGMKVFWIADAEQNFPLYGVPYLGRPAGQERQVNLGRNIAVELATPFFKSGRNVTCDNFFTDLTLSETLLKNGMTLVGTVRANKRFLPDSLKTKKHLALNDSEFSFTADATVVRYQSKKKKKRHFAELHAQQWGCTSSRGKPKEETGNCTLLQFHQRSRRHIGQDGSFVHCETQDTEVANGHVLQYSGPGHHCCSVHLEDQVPTTWPFFERWAFCFHSKHR